MANVVHKLGPSYTAQDQICPWLATFPYHSPVRATSCKIPRPLPYLTPKLCGAAAAIPWMASFVYHFITRKWSCGTPRWPLPYIIPKLNCDLESSCAALLLLIKRLQHFSSFAGKLVVRLTMKSEDVLDLRKHFTYAYSVWEFSQVFQDIREY